MSLVSPLPQAGEREGGEGAELAQRFRSPLYGIQLAVDTDDCCLVFLRSRSRDGGFSQISPLINGNVYFDTDMQPGDSFFYQALVIDAGVPGASTLDMAPATGEILAASDCRGWCGRLRGLRRETPPRCLSPA